MDAISVGLMIIGLLNMWIVRLLSDTDIDMRLVILCAEDDTLSLPVDPGQIQSADHGCRINRRELRSALRSICSGSADIDIVRCADGNSKRTAAVSHSIAEVILPFVIGVFVGKELDRAAGAGGSRDGDGPDHSGVGEDLRGLNAVVSGIDEGNAFRSIIVDAVRTEQVIIRQAARSGNAVIQVIGDMVVRNLVAPRAIQQEHA